MARSYPAEFRRRPHQRIQTCRLTSHDTISGTHGVAGMARWASTGSARVAADSGGVVDSA